MSTATPSAGTSRARLSRIPLPRWSPDGRREPALLFGAIVAFLGMTVWWLTQDERVQDWDNGLHTVDAFTVKTQLVAGQFTAPFTDFNGYPPFGHIVGAIGILIGGVSPTSVIIAENLVFVPVLAISCYGVGKIVYGTPLAGLLAALFALGTPMVVSEMHEFLLDPQEAAMIAASVWGILASRRFERTGVAVAAGATAGIAMMTKQTAIFFFVGPAMVAVVRGGWRAWRGLLAYAVALAVIAAPWYAYHLQQLLPVANAASSAAGWIPAGATTTSSRFSILSLGYYFWDALNIQLLVPLALLFAIGVLGAVRGLIPRPRPDDLRFDLLVGAFVGWIGVGVVLVDRDPRYSLPDLVYFAVLGSGWIAVSTKRLRPLLVGALGAIIVVNFAGVSTGTAGVAQLTLPGHTTGSIERELTFYSPDGWLHGGPSTDGHIPSLMTGLYRAGIRVVTWDGASTNQEDFNQSGLNVRALQAGLEVSPAPDPGNLGPHEVYVVGRIPAPGDPPPCRRLENGYGVYAVLHSALGPWETLTFICPGRHPEIYHRTAPLTPDVVAQIEPRIPQPWRSRYVTLFRTMSAQGIKEVQVDYASSVVPFFARVQTLALVTKVGLQAEPFNPGTRDNQEAFLVRHADGVGEPEPCIRFPDGTGLYIVLGYAYIPFNKYEFYCPTRNPSHYTASTG
jgi:hypothetical protein